MKTKNAPLKVTSTAAQKALQEAQSKDPLSISLNIKGMWQCAYCEGYNKKTAHQCAFCFKKKEPMKIINEQLGSPLVKKTIPKAVGSSTVTAANVRQTVKGGPGPRPSSSVRKPR